MILYGPEIILSSFSTLLSEESETLTQDQKEEHTKQRIAKAAVVDSNTT